MNTPVNLTAIKQNMFSGEINPVTISSFEMSDIDYVISSHRTLYSKEYCLSSVFGDYVEKGVKHFVQHYDGNKECMLIARMNGKPVGSIVIAKSNAEIAQLRYFLLDPQVRGMGLGHKLVDMVLDFCVAKGYSHVFLETISALKTARHIYKSKGFHLTLSHENLTWGEGVLEERWDLDL